MAQECPTPFVWAGATVGSAVRRYVPLTKTDGTLCDAKSRFRKAARIMRYCVSLFVDPGQTTQPAATGVICQETVAQCQAEFGTHYRFTNQLFCARNEF